MYIRSVNSEPVTVDDYDITFANGLCMTITIDRAAGDTVDFTSNPLATIFHLAEKPSPNNAKLLLRAEESTIFMSHVLAIQHRTRVVTPITPEMKDELQKTILSKTTTIH